ncbi:secreted trypsin-like serine protease [Kibdelosporangium banguiense]|uniref:Secreted trypsin-like serine protease n=1 Tax=Kibdelosporangium banguiense TaxID=1365924 RepID=A0ABS4THC3_9PSEU|nr:serine protease [Kibdelosporangium banguiense]MBP2323794.1 secreted trypsin-like serine protease [Kibdelosporangium banguiense]
MKTVLSEVGSPRSSRKTLHRLALAGGTLVTALATVAVAPSSAAAGDVQPNIIGGHAASEPYPWMVSLQINWKGDPDFHTCGGVLLFRDQVVTNAHCVTNPPGQTVPELGWHVRVGSHNRNSGGQTAGVSKITVHPEWAWGAGAPEKRVADLALLKLDRKLDLQTIELAAKPARPGDKVRLLGWGVTEPDGSGPLPSMLQELDTTVVPAAKCAAWAISGGEICTNPNGTDGPCAGDSGGPALKKEDGRWKLVGGTSRGSEWCGTDTGVYTSSPEYRQWMYDTARGVPVPIPALPVPSKDPGYGLPFERLGGVK